MDALHFRVVRSLTATIQTILAIVKLVLNGKKNHV